jgi:Uma2 family endonuclease
MVTTATMTAEDLLEHPDDGLRHELIEGEITTMTPAGARHGTMVARITVLLGKHVDEFRSGHLFGAETGFIIARDPDTVRAPDVAFVAAERATEVPRGFFEGAPDLAVEVTSPSDSYSEVQKKALAWLRAGCHLVLVVDADERTVTAYRSPRDVRVHGVEDEVPCEDIVTGWRPRAEKFFA